MPQISRPPQVPDTLCLTALPPRVQRLLRLVLTHQAILCVYDTASIELHCRADSVKAKIVLHPQEE